MVQTSHVYQLHSVTQGGFLEEEESAGFTDPNVLIPAPPPGTPSVNRSYSNLNLYPKCLFLLSGVGAAARCFSPDPVAV